MMRNIWKDGIFGVVTGDALGCPVQFESREEVAEHPVTGMRGYGAFNLPAGSWTDDSSLTHAHARAKIACGLYWFMIREVLNGTGSLTERMQAGLEKGFAYYEEVLKNKEELAFYNRLRNLAEFAQVPAEEIRSSGYVVDTLEAAVWSLITTESFKEALLKAVNLGHDTDTVGAIAGGLAALFYGYEVIPSDWIAELKREKWIEELCEIAEERFACMKKTKE